MFLDVTERRNPALIDAAIALHRDGRIEPDTYVIDLDAVRDNAAALARAADEARIELWFVAKQYGRNPIVSAAIAEHIPLATAIDHREADALLDANVQLANLGHLVQVPRRRLPSLLAAANPAWVTVADEGNLEAVAEAAAALDRVQRILVRIAGDPDVTYPGQEGGVELDQLEPFVRRAAALPSIDLQGATGFPCVIFDPAVAVPRPTRTLERVLEARSLLAQHGIDAQISLPSHTSVATLPMLAEVGAAFAEPGHALTGSTPQHAHDDALAERPAMVYVSEVAQMGSAPGVFGGGFYPRGHARSVRIETARGPRRATLHDAPAASIDYYRRFDLDGDGDGDGDGAGAVRVGDTAVMAFRTQIFVTRSRVATVSGIAAGAPVLQGIHDALGRELA